MQRPLSEELRPRSFEDFFGQPGPLFTKLLQGEKPLSILLFGPPGCGKTTLAKIYIKTFVANTFSFHPASHSVADLKKWIQQLEESPLFSKTNILFIDEIHRMNKAQQDVLLPFLENGTFCLVAATTEHPSFSLNNALLSRLRVIPLKPLDPLSLERILEKALHIKGLTELSVEDKQYLISASQGDARHLLNCVENLLVGCAKGDPFDITLATSIKQPLYDKAGDGHFGLISALHKSIRASDPNAALYWLARMLEGGEDPSYIGRRLVRIAIEDIGLADPGAQAVALHAWEIYERLGSPEGNLALGEAVLFLALAPKSTSAYEAFSKAQELARSSSHLPPPSFLLNHPLPRTESEEEELSRFPKGVKETVFYEPFPIGFERELKKRNDFFTKRDIKKPM